jgi:hypothetical protein
MCSNETHSEVHINKRLSDIIPIENGLKQTDAVLPLLFNLSFEYTCKKVQENQV